LVSLYLRTEDNIDLSRYHLPFHDVPDRQSGSVSIRKVMFVRDQQYHRGMQLKLYPKIGQQMHETPDEGRC